MVLVKKCTDYQFIRKHQVNLWLSYVHTTCITCPGCSAFNPAYFNHRQLWILSVCSAQHTHTPKTHCNDESETIR
ncbi:hypothetical protein L2E82_40614 [Cichorium intybus]|uniref:Uncharacterized protein n=1 Tax=Cichorium intybus TaxID=13427 RepID=A0ACB9AMF6_CICIN|nr:hypothetical protein L2E82_40614 [Cichorium intybus]